MSTPTGQHAGTSTQEHHGATAEGYARQHNGNAYCYYASDMRIAGLTEAFAQIKTPNEAATENGAKLWRAARLGQLPRVQRLLKLGADVSYRCNEHGTTALHQAVSNSHKDVVRALLEADASVDDDDHEGHTVLHFATSVDIVELLIMDGADVDHEDREGKTPGRLALDRKNTAVVEALINGCADPSKIYGPESSRFVTASNQSKEEKTETQSDQFRRALDVPPGYEANTGGKELQTAPKPHTIHPGRSHIYKQDFITHETTTSVPEACDKLSRVDSTHVLDGSKSHPERRLFIGIMFSNIVPPDVKADYGVGQHGNSPETYAKHRQGKYMYRVTGSSFPPFKDLVRHMVYDDTAAEGRANSAWLGDNNPDRAGKFAKEVLSDYIEALLIHISTKAASQRGEPPLGKSDTELVMLVPTAWPCNLKRTILHAARAANLREAALVTSIEGSVLYALYHKWTKPAEQILDGDVYLICDLGISSVSCTRQEVVSTKPFQLRRLGQRRDSVGQSDESKGLDTLRDQSLEAIKCGQDMSENRRRWEKQIGEYIARRALATDSLGTEVKAIVLFSTGWTPGTQAEIHRHCPEIKIICSNTQLFHNLGENTSTLLRGTVMHQLRHYLDN